MKPDSNWWDRSRAICGMAALSGAQRNVLHAIHSYAGRERATALAEIAETCGISRNTANWHKRNLGALGVLSWERAGNGNRYVWSGPLGSDSFMRRI